MNSRFKLKSPLDLIVIYLLLTIGIATAGYHYYEKQKEIFKEEKKNAIYAISDLKVNQITSWRKERLGDAGVVFDNSYMASQIEQYLDNQEAPGLKQTISTWMYSLQKNYQYEGVLLLDARGNVQLSVPENKDTIGPQAKALFEDAMRLKKPLFSDFYWSETARVTRISLLVPLFVQKGEGASPVGVLLLRIDPYQFLYPLIQLWPTPSQTAESVLIRREGQEIVFLNELRHQKDTALSLRFSVSQGQHPAADVGAQESVVEGLDYRGVPVLAGVRQVPESSWFLVAKVDEEEIYAPVRERAWSTAMISGVLILLTGAGIIFFWRRQQALFYRKQYEAELERRALTRHYEYLTRYANDIILLVDWDLKIIEANDRAVLSYGYTCEELLQLKVQRLRPFTARSKLASQTKQIEKMDGLVYETVHQRKDGTIFPVEISSRIIEIEGGKFYQSIIRDITERKRLEEALCHSEEHFRSLIENALDIITSLDGNGTIRYESPSVKSVLGYDPEELLGRSVFDFIHPEDAPTAVDALRQMRVLEDSHRFEVRFLHKDGSWRILECLSNNLLSNPAVKGIIVNSRDVTGRRQMEEKIKKMNADLERRVVERTTQLEASNKELEAFCYSVSHDLRSPLRSADGFSQALLEDYCDQMDEQARDYLRRIRAACQRMGQLIDDLLNLSRVTRSEMYREEVNLSALVMEIAEELKQFQPERQVEFAIAPGETASADPRLIRVVLENLLSNAWKFSGKHPRARIEFGTTEHDGQTVYYVRDDGVGFEMAYVEKLFGAFQRLHSMAEFPGTGIGLATVQRIIHRHGGKVWAVGTLGKGATFYFTL